MIYTPRLFSALHFAIDVHEGRQKQKRKGTDVPYITHPMTVALILCEAGASEDVVIAGLLHDVIEDSPEAHSVNRDEIADRFGEAVAELVAAVSEKDKGLGWHERKEAAHAEMKDFSQDALLLKSADVISNNTELIRDYQADGDSTFARFNAPKEDSIAHTVETIETILAAWPGNPLREDLEEIVRVEAKW